MRRSTLIILLVSLPLFVFGGTSSVGLISAEHTGGFNWEVAALVFAGFATFAVPMVTLLLVVGSGRSHDM